MTAIDKVRSMVDRRIAALEERRAKRSGASGMARSRASFESTEAGSESRASYSCSLSHIDIGKVF